MSDQPFDLAQVDELRRSMRELVGLSSLPAVWVANDPPAMADGLAKVLCRCLPASFAYVRLIDEDGIMVAEAAESDRGTERNRARDIGHTLEPFMAAGDAVHHEPVPNPVGDGVVRLAITKIGHVGEFGTVATGSERALFPSPIDRLLLGVAINQAAIILQQKRSQAQLRRSERALADFFDNASVGLHWGGPDGTIVRVNRAELSLLGYTEDEYVGRHVSAFHADEAVITDILHRLHAGEQLRDHPARMLAKDGSIKHVMIDASVMWDGGKFIHTRCFTRDVTEQRLAEGQRRRQSERLRLLWETAGVLLGADNADTMLRDLIAAIGPHLGVDSYFHYAVSANDGTLELTSSAGIEHGALSRLIQPLAGSVVGTVVEHRRPVMIDGLQNCDRGATHWLQVAGLRALSCQPLLAGDRLIGILAFGSRTTGHFDAEEQSFIETVCHYVTLAHERLHLLSELKEGDRRKDEFLATLAHELRNPLAPVRNAVQILQLPAMAETDSQRARAIIARQIAVMARLIDDLMDVSRINRGHIELRREPVDLHRVLELAIEATRPHFTENGHELRLSVPQQPIPLDADVTRLSQVLVNLLTNAAKYTEPGGHVDVCVEVVDGTVRIAVRDDGIGLAREHLDQVFDMFAQVESAMSRSRGGLGIGLSLVKHLVELHGGRVGAESPGPGRGSTFTVALPLSATPALPVREGVDETGSPGRVVAPLRILVVEDHPDGAATIAELLSRLGHSVRTVHDGGTALQSAEEFRPELVLLDIGLPTLSGYEVCRRLRGEVWGSALKIVAMTGWGDAEAQRKARAAGFDRHLVKPVDQESLLDTLVMASAAAVAPAKAR